MRILVIDGQGGRIGRGIIEQLIKGGFNGEIIAVGTNSSATEAMMKAGAGKRATAAKTEPDGISCFAGVHGKGNGANMRYNRYEKRYKTQQITES